MNSIDQITARLEAAKERSIKDANQDVMMAKLQKLFKYDNPFDQLMVLMAYQNTLMIEISNDSADHTAVLWDSCRIQSAELMKAYFQKKQPRKEVMN